MAATTINPSKTKFHSKTRVRTSQAIRIIEETKCVRFGLLGLNADMPKAAVYPGLLFGAAVNPSARSIWSALAYCLFSFLFHSIGQHMNENNTKAEFNSY
jgi:hypothetical protein